MKPARPRRSAPRRAEWRPEILYEDAQVIAVNKPAGLLSIATDKGELRTLHALLNNDVARRSRGAERVFIVHRLDREVSGVMLFAKSLEAQETLQRNWSGCEKVYYALVEGRPPAESGTIRTWLRENRAFRVYSTTEGGEAKLAVTHYRVVRSMRDHTMLEVRIETGRKHQIRAHLSELGCPIVGDERYGAAKSRIRGLGLCARSLAFDHPATGRRMRLEVPMPRGMMGFRERPVPGGRRTATQAPRAVASGRASPEGRSSGPPGGSPASRGKRRETRPEREAAPPRVPGLTGVAHS